jgi:endonuclease I/chitodextrinase
MKEKILFIVSILLFSTAFCQIPSNYYNNATGTGYTLKTQLKTIITNGHSDQGYGNLYSGYQTTHIDNYYENDGSVLDFYSENPTGTDTYFYTHGSNNCGNYNSENDCYNREHLMPQSVFSSASPMKNDIHFVVPSDGYVNGKRSSFAFGEISNPTWTSSNGSKLGPNTFGSYNGTVFEPVDEFKGDIARSLLYFATRYESQVSSWNHSGMLNGTNDQVYQDWFLDLLISWHNDDPVNQQEIDRNNAAYNYQGNANPYINHPEWVNTIWSTNTDTENPTAPTNLITSNPTASTVDLVWTTSIDNIAVTSYDIYVNGVNTYNTINTSFIANNLNSETNYCFTVFARDAANNTSSVSNKDCEITLTDNEAPTVPANITITNQTGSGFKANWTASTDNAAVVGYDVFVDGTFNASTVNTSYSVIDLTASTTYSVTILAKDEAGNKSAQSTAVDAVTTDGSAASNEIFFSEYIEGSSNNKAIEIANYTGQTVSLANYSIKLGPNGDDFGTQTLTFTTETIVDGDVYVIGNSQIAICTSEVDISSKVTYFNGNDALGLFKNDVLIDIIGEENNSSYFGAEVTLQRKSTITSPNTVFNKTGEWVQGSAVDDCTDLGIHSVSTASLYNSVFNSFKIYPNPTNGNTLYFNFTKEVTIRMYNVLGKLIKTNKINSKNNKIDISALPKGIYLLKINSENQFITKKIIKN